MPKVTLLQPRSINTLGIHFKKGEPVEVDDHIAAQLSEDPRFQVGDVARGGVIVLDSDDGRPGSRVKRLDAIREAADQLAEDDEAFDENGLPKSDKLEEILGWPVSKREVAEAMQKANPAVTLETRDPDKKPGASAAKRITIRKSKQAQGGALDTGEGKEGEGGPSDAEKEGAVDA